MAERMHGAIALAAAAVVIVTVVEWRALRPANAGAARNAAPVPSPQLRQLIAYAGPITDSQLTVRTQTDSVALRRDPFAKDVAARVAEPRGGSAPHVTAPLDSPQWRVSATLISSARRAAIINDVLTYVGDRVPGGGTLVSVERDRVILTDAKGASHTVMAEKEGT